MKVSKILRFICIIILLIAIWHIYYHKLWTSSARDVFCEARLLVYTLLFGFIPTLYGISCILKNQGN